ncbi:MAG TPA: hypothetical protein VIH03_05845 [Nitrososphaerales archaeon]
MPAKDDEYDVKLFRSLHHDVDIDRLLGFLHAKIDDSLRQTNSNAMRILDQGARLAAKCMFLIRHYDYYIRHQYKPRIHPSEDWFHLQDQFREVQLEMIHSLLAARIGMVKQAINVLRRCFELGVYGSFYSTASYVNDDGTKVNPFIMLTGTGHWAKLMSNKAVRLKDIERIIDELRKNDNLSKGEAEKEVLVNFPKYYILRFTLPYCDEHKPKDNPIDQFRILNVDLPPFWGKMFCIACNKEAHVVLLEKPLTTKLMIAIIDAKFRNKVRESQMDMQGLYGELSRFLHPNPESHQHHPNFDLKSLELWLALLTQTLHAIIWLYARSLEYIGYDEKTTTALLNSKEYNLHSISLGELLVTICSKVGEQYNQSNYNKKKTMKLPLLLVHL